MAPAPREIAKVAPEMTRVDEARIWEIVKEMLMYQFESLESCSFSRAGQGMKNSLGKKVCRSRLIKLILFVFLLVSVTTAVAQSAANDSHEVTAPLMLSGTTPAFQAADQPSSTPEPTDLIVSSSIIPVPSTIS